MSRHPNDSSSDGRTVLPSILPHSGAPASKTFPLAVVELCPKCARGDPTTANSSQCHTRRGRTVDRRNRFSRRDLHRERPAAAIARNHRGWPCKTSIPGSNPGGASKILSKFARLVVSRRVARFLIAPNSPRICSSFQRATSVNHCIATSCQRAISARRRFRGPPPSAEWSWFRIRLPEQLIYIECEQRTVRIPDG